MAIQQQDKPDQESSQPDRLNDPKNPQQQINLQKQPNEQPENLQKQQK